jgi:hypothetical protein
MSCKDIPHRLLSFGGLSAAAVALIAGQAFAEPVTVPGNLTTSACASTFSRTPVSIFGSGVFIGSPPAVDFNFWLNVPSGSCDAHNVKVTWVYQVADKATQKNLKTVVGSTTYPLISRAHVTVMAVHCVPTVKNGYCRDASATVLPGNFTGGAVIQGNATAALGPVAP